MFMMKKYLSAISQQIENNYIDALGKLGQGKDSHVLGSPLTDPS